MLVKNRDIQTFGEEDNRQARLVAATQQTQGKELH